MKQFLLSLTLLVSFTFIGCSDDEKSNQWEFLPQLLGSWQRQDSPSQFTYVKFNENFTVEYSSFDFVTGTSVPPKIYNFRLEQGRLGIKKEGEYDWYKYTVEGTTLMFGGRVHSKLYY